MLDDSVVTSPFRVLAITRGARSERWLSALRAAGYACEEVPDANAGLDRVSDGNRFDALVWDSEAPGVTVEQALEQGRLALSIPAIVLYARTDRARVLPERSPVRWASLSKPVDEKALLGAVDDVLQATRAGRVVSEVRKQLAEMSQRLAAVEALLVRRAEPQESGDGERLSARELEIARALAAGQRVSDIAAAFGLSRHTVRNHFKAIFRKLNVHSQVELLARLRQM